MRSYVASAVLAGAVALAPVVAGYAPASSQDFSITNPGAGPGSDWTRKLQAWWDLHAYYPDALEKKEAGTVKVHLEIHSDGEVWKPEVVQGSGSKSIDMAAYEVFKDGHLPPFPSGAPAPQVEVNLALHYVLEHRPSKSPFTIGTDPPRDTVVDTMMAQTCTGTWVPIWWAHRPHLAFQAVFYPRADGTKWVRFYYNGNGPEDRQVTELGVSAQWTTLAIFKGAGAAVSGAGLVHYEVWPANGPGDTHLVGKTVDPWGTMDFNCKFEPTWWGSGGAK